MDPYNQEMSKVISRQNIRYFKGGHVHYTSIDELKSLDVTSGEFPYQTSHCGLLPVAAKPLLHELVQVSRSGQIRYQTK